MNGKHTSRTNAIEKMGSTMGQQILTKMKRVSQQLLLKKIPSPRGWPRHSRWRSRTESPRQHHSWWPRWWDTRSPASAARCTHTERDANTREIKHSPAASDVCGINTHLTAELSRHQLQVSSLQIRHSERKQDFIILISYRQETDTYRLYTSSDELQTERNEGKIINTSYFIIIMKSKWNEKESVLH